MGNKINNLAYVGFHTKTSLKTAIEANKFSAESTHLGVNMFIVSGYIPLLATIVGAFCLISMCMQINRKGSSPEKIICVARYSIAITSLGFLILPPVDLITTIIREFYLRTYDEI